MNHLKEKIILTIITRMVSLRLWKSNHIRYDNLKQCGFPKNLSGEVENTINLLIKKEIIVYYNKSKKAIQLNWNKRREIFSILENERIELWPLKAKIRNFINIINYNRIKWK